jgi:hypothetical protein
MHNPPDVNIKFLIFFVTRGIRASLISHVSIATLKDKLSPI